MAEPLKDSMAISSGSFRKKNAEVSALSYERIQPQAVELEQAVLGAVMLDKDAISVVLDILKPEAFYKPAHQKTNR